MDKNPVGSLMDPPYSRQEPVGPKASIGPLAYEIHACSSQSSTYHPSNIAVNKPLDQSSRWSSASNNQMQFITLKLPSLSVVDTITFGKYHKVHVCNLKEFKVFGGVSPDHMIELLHSGLRNDSEPETFALKHKANGVVYPNKGANFNFSIWFVELHGISQPLTVSSIYWQYTNFRETEALRLCLKHFRQRNYMDCFDALQARSQLRLEDPLLTSLHSLLVLKGDFDAAENLLSEGANRDLFSDYIASCTHKPLWHRIHPKDPNSETPSMRGGHQMCIDVEGGKIYLFGGWDGSKDLSDLWLFEESVGEWKCLSHDTRKQNGPGPRSCHKICFDPKMKQLYTLGRYVDQESRPNVPLDNDFWRFDLASQTWTRISASTQQEGGPELIYDHQMVVDSDRQVLYIFGGRTVAPDITQTAYSGLYSYSIPNNRWTLIRTDTSQPENAIQLKSRIGHSMLFNQETRELYIFAGQRNKDYLSDFYIYEIDSDTVYEVARDYSKQGGPDAGFTQRAALDVTFGEIYIFSGLMREKNATQETVRNAFWVYSLKLNRWTRVYQNENTGSEYWSKMGATEPRPRYAHQLVYDPIRRKQFLFGGNPGESGNASFRLDDFWELTLLRPSVEDILRQAKFLIRRQKFWELCRGNSGTLNALQYLQTQVSAVVNHEDEAESKAFRELTGFLFLWKNEKGPLPTPAIQREGVDGGMAMDEDDSVGSFSYRTTLYESLLEFFPDRMKEPKGTLVDLVPMN